MLAGGDRWTLVANLPYNVATPLVCDLLDDVPAIEPMLVMVQREVAERFAAAPGSKQYGAVSVKIAYWASARLVGLVPPSVFVPRPNVESALVEIDRREPPDVDPERVVLARADGVRAASQDVAPIARRARRTRRVFAAAGVSPEARPEQLDVDAWCGSRTPTSACMSADLELSAPAKLTLSLRITGVRDDGYHLIDAEMVSLSCTTS